MIQSLSFGPSSHTTPQSGFHNSPDLITVFTFSLFVIDREHQTAISDSYAEFTVEFFHGCCHTWNCAITFSYRSIHHAYRTITRLPGSVKCQHTILFCIHRLFVLLTVTEKRRTLIIPMWNNEAFLYFLILEISTSECMHICCIEKSCV